MRPTGSGHPRAWGWEARGINLALRGPRPTRPEIPGLAGTRLPDHKRSRLLQPWCPHPPPGDTRFGAWPTGTQGMPAAGALARDQRRGLPPPRSVGQEGREPGPKRPGGRRPQRSRFQASEGRPGGRAGLGAPPCPPPPPPSPAPSLLSAGQCQRTTCHFPAAWPRRGEGAAGPGPRCLCRGPPGLLRSDRAGISLSSSPRSPHRVGPAHPPPPPRPGQAQHTWAGDRALAGRGRGSGLRARAPGRRRRAAGLGPDGGGCGGRGWGGWVEPGHGGFTFSLLQSARPSPTQPHRRSPQPFPAPRTDPARRPPLLRRRSRRPHVTGAQGGAALSAPRRGAHGICSAPSRDSHCPPPCPLPNFGTPRPTPL